MAVVCVLAVAFVLLLPLTQSRGEAGADLGGQRTVQGIQAKADKCQDSTVQDQSPPPSDADGTTIKAIKERGYLNVGVDQNSYRWGYLDPNSSGELEGFDIDLVTPSPRTSSAAPTARARSSSWPSRPTSASRRSRTSASTWWSAP
jgi:polar amino acid transport system substrate-binding protein